MSKAKISGQHIKKRQFLFNPLKRPLPYVGLILGILIIVFQQGIRNYTAILVGDILVQSVKDATGGLYTINHDLVRFDIITKELRIKDFSIDLDTAVTNHEEFLQSHSNLLNIRTPLIVLKLKSMYELLMNNNLYINYVGVQDPDLVLTRSSHIQRNKTELEENTRSVSKLLKGYVRRLEIDSFRIDNASFEIYNHKENDTDEPDFKMAHLSALVKDFRIDPDAPNYILRGMSAKYIDLEIKDQEIFLPNHDQNISFKRLLISSADSVVTIDSLTIKSTSSSKGYLNLFFPSIDFRNVDYSTWFFNNKMNSKSVVINNPTIHIKTVEFVDSIPKPAGEQLVEFIEGFSIEDIRVNNGTLNVESKHPLKIENFNLHITDYTLESKDIFQTNLLTDSLNLSLDAKEISWQLPDSIHQLNASSVSLSKMDSLLKITNLTIIPIKGRTNYATLKKHRVPMVLKVYVDELSAIRLDVSALIEHQELISDSLKINRARGFITNYPYIKRIDHPLNLFSKIGVKQLNADNSYVYYNNRFSGKNHVAEFTRIKLSLEDINDSVDGLSVHSLKAMSKSGHIELPEMGHILKFEGLSVKDWDSAFAAKLELVPDSASLPLPMCNIKSENLLITGFDKSLFENDNFLKIDTLMIGSFSSSIDLSNQKDTSNTANNFKKLQVGYFQINSGKLVYNDQLKNLSLSGFTSSVSAIKINFLQSDTAQAVSFDSLEASYKEIKFMTKNNRFDFQSSDGKISENDSLIFLNNLKLRLDSPSFNLNAHTLTVRGFNKNDFLSKGIYNFHSIRLDQPQLDLAGTSNGTTIELSSDGIRSIVLNLTPYLHFDSLLTIEGGFSWNNSGKGRSVQIKNINSLLSDYTLDSSTSVSQLFRPQLFEISADSFLSIGKNDTIKIENIKSNINEGWLTTGNISSFLNLDSIIIRSTAPALAANGFTPAALINSDITLDKLHIDQANIILTVKGSSEMALYPFVRDSLSVGYSYAKLFSNIARDSTTTGTLLKRNALEKHVEKDTSAVITQVNMNQKDSLEISKVSNPSDSSVSFVKNSAPELTLLQSPNTINHFRFTNAQFNWSNPANPNSPFKHINFDIDATSLELKSIEKFNINNHTEHITVSITDHKINLPDGLNTVHFDTLQISIGPNQVRLKNLKLSSKVGKFEYASKVGHQVNWTDLDSLSVVIDNMNYSEFIRRQAIVAKKITFTKANLSIFRDKEVPPPENRLRAMPQDVLENFAFPVNVDSIVIRNFDVSYSTQLTSEMSIGEVSFNNIEALATNLTNIDSLIDQNPYVMVHAYCRLMNQGDLTTNFNFLMHDPENRFVFDANLGSMDMRAFNSILEATAFVSINSGNVKSIKLDAQGDDVYAAGKITFLYDNLKISTINKKNLKTKGMGKVIRTFFANAFVVKKNNPNYKIFPRIGEMYYERDDQKLIFDYAQKTAMSGVVSSIGARSNRKEIKRIQKQSKQQKEKAKKIN